DPLTRRDQARRLVDDGEDRPLVPEPGPTTRLAVAGGAVRCLDGRADRPALGPPATSLGLPAALDPPRLADRLRNDPPGDRPDRDVPVPAEAEHPPLAAGPDPGRLGLLGLAAGPRRVVRARHPQGVASAQPRPVGPALGTALVQAVGAQWPTA